jgi:hypothetical protein
MIRWIPQKAVAITANLDNKALITFLVEIDKKSKKRIKTPEN